MFDRLKTWLGGKTADGPRLPAGHRIYAFGDIHGRLDLLDPLLERAVADIDARPVAHPIFVFLGDYVDRGVASSGVITRLVQLSEVFQTICLKGNHEAYFMNFLRDGNFLEYWARVGALPTLMSYRLAPSLKPDAAEAVKLSSEMNETLPETHRTFLSGLSTSFVCGDYLFVHAGIRPNLTLNQQREEDLLSIREEFLTHGSPFEKFVVHGHTPVKEPDERSNRINIDTGAYATGRLSCLCIEEESHRIF